MPKVFGFVEREIRGLHEAAYLLGAFALLSALLAILRDRLLAGTFGAGQTLDIYYAAFRIPDIVFISIASLASVFILVPVLSAQKTEQEQRDTIGNIVLAFSMVMLLGSVVLFVLLPYILPLLFPTLVGSGELLTLSRILLLQPIFLGLSGILASITQFHGRFMLYAIAPLLYNGGIIFGIAVLYPILGLAGLTWGVVLGAFLHLFIQVPFVLKKGYLKPSAFRLDLQELWRITSTSIPRTISVAANQVALLVLVVIAAGLGAGSVSVFNLALNLQAAPLGIIGASYSVAAFPTLARYFARGEYEQFLVQIITATRHVIFWSVPLIALVVVLRAQIVRVTLGAGEFDWSDTRLTAAALALFIISLTAQALSLLFVRGYYAAGETWKPLLVNVVTAVGIVVSAVWFVHLFQTHDVWRFFVEGLLRVEDIPGTVVLSLPLAFTLFSVINVLVFLYLFERDFKTFSRKLSRVLFESFSAAVVAGFVAHRALVVFSEVFDLDTFVGIFTQGLLAGIAGIASGVIVLAALQNKEIKEVWRALHHKFWKSGALFSSISDR